MFDCYNRIPCNGSRITPTSCNSCRVCRGDLKALSSRVHPIFAFIFPLISYLAIGPFFAIPRTGAVSFEMGMKPLLSEAMVSEWYMLFLFTIVFFGITWYLSLNPSKLVDWFGKFLTPLLVLIVAVIVGKAIIDPIESRLRR